MAIKAGRVGVNPSSVDELGNVTVGGLTPEERAKLEKALVSPVTTPTEKELVGIGTANEQIMFKIGNGLSVDGETSPFTLKASGGGGITWSEGVPLTGGSGMNWSDIKAYRAPGFVLISGTFRPSGAITKGSTLTLFNLTGDNVLPVCVGDKPEQIIFSGENIGSCYISEGSGSKVIKGTLKPITGDFATANYSMFLLYPTNETM